MSATAPAAASAPPLPSGSVLLRAAKIAVDEDRPILLDYYGDSLKKLCCIGVREDGDKSLVKSSTDYTSTIENIFRFEDCYIVLTENSLYIVSSSIVAKKIASTQSDEKVE